MKTTTVTASEFWRLPLASVFVTERERDVKGKFVMLEKVDGMKLV